MATRSKPMAPARRRLPAAWAWCIHHFMLVNNVHGAGENLGPRTGLAGMAGRRDPRWARDYGLNEKVEDLPVGLQQRSRS